MLEILEKWEKTTTDLDAQIEKLRDFFGCVECDFLDAIEKMQCEYTKAIAEQVGDCGGWLIWYWLDNSMGNAKMDAGYDGKLTQIEGLYQLVDLISASAQR